MARFSSSYIQIPCRVRPIKLLGRKPISKIGKAVALVKMDVVPVLAPEPFQHVEEANAAARVKSRDRTTDSATLKPGRARSCPGSTRHECLRVLVQLIHCRPARRDGFDALDLALLNGADDILGEKLGDGEDTPMADGGVWAKENFVNKTTPGSAAGLAHYQAMGRRRYSPK